MLRLAALSLAILLSGTASALAACPVGKDEGDTWCEDGVEWKCERCGSEYCPIITGNSCHQDDERRGAAASAISSPKPIALDVLRQ